MASLATERTPPSSAETTAASFSLSEARHIVRDLFTPNPWIFWADFLLSLVVGDICFGLVRKLPAWSLAQAGVVVVSGFMYYTHLDHHRRKHYGTKQDGEYIPLSHQSPWAIIFYLSQSFVIPGLAVV